MKVLGHEQYRQPTHHGPQNPPFYNAGDIINLNDIELFRTGQPIEAYHRLLKEAPVYWQHEDAFEGEPGYWAVTSYNEVKKIGQQADIFSSQKGGINTAFGKPEDFHPLLSVGALDNMIAMDGMPHLELRRQHMPFFTADYIRKLKVKVDAKVAELLDDVEKAGSGCNLVDVFSAQLPLYTLSELLGIPESDRPKLVQWMEDLEMAFYFGMIRSGVLQPTPEIMQAYMGWEERIAEFFDYGETEIRKRKENPQEDLLTAIANAIVEGEELPDPYLTGSWELIFIAGNDTTRNSISGMMKLLTDNPDQKEKLIANRDLMPNAVQEAIRLISPVIHMKRIALEDTQVGEQPIKEGEKVVLWYGAANRDASVFPDPDRFDIERANAKDHLAFGFGKHVCLGKQIALMQLESVYDQLLDRFPQMEVSGDMVCAPNNFVHAISELPVRF